MKLSLFVPAYLNLSRLACVPVACLCAAANLLTSCGGGGSGTGTPPPSPDFSISVSSSSISAQAGTTSGPVTVSVTGSNGFSGSVAVTISGLPSGVTCSPSCSLSINAGSSAQVSFVLPANATTGTVALTVQGTSGSLSHSAPLSLTISAAADFSISVSPSSISAQAGTTSAAVTVSITGANGFSGSVSVTIGGLSSGVTCSPSCSPSINAGSSAQISFVLPTNATTGTVALTVQGTSGNLSHSAPLSLTITAAADFSISVSPSSISTQAGTTSAPVTVSITSANGFSGSVSVTIGGLPSGVTCSPSCSLSISANSSAQVSFAVPSNATVGTTALTVQGTSGSLSHSAPLSLTVTSIPAPAISGLSTSSGTTGSTLTITGTNFGSTEGSSTVTFNGVSAGAASAWSATSISVTVPSGATTGNVVVTVGGQASNGVLFTVLSPDFSITVAPSSVSTEMGTTSAPVTISVTGSNGFSGAVSVAISGLPAGTTCSPSCNLSINSGSSAQVSFVVPSNATTGTVALTVKGTSGSLSHSQPLSLTITTSLQGAWNLDQFDTLISKNPATVSGKIFVSGWAFEGIPLTAVTVLVDNVAIGNAFYGTPRPDVLSLPGAFEDCGFSLALDTTTLSNGTHTISVSATDSAKNVGQILNYPNATLTVQINVNNPTPVATGPVVNLTLNAPTTSLTVGTIVGFTASATNASAQAVAPSFTWSSTNSSIAKVTPTGAVFPLAVGNATISVTAGGQTQQVAVTVVAGSGTPGSIEVSLGPEEVVFQYDRDACMEGDNPDNPARAVRLSDGSILLVGGDNPFIFAEAGAGFWSLSRRCTPVLVSTDSPMASTFLNRQWIFSMYSDGTTIHALIHNEFHDPIAANCKPGDSTDGNPCQYTSITYATSVDGGQTFTTPASPQNVVAPPPAQWVPPASSTLPYYPNFYYGYQAPTNIVHASDGYYYAHFIEFPPPPASPSSGTCVMRTQTLSDPSSWLAWDGTAYELQMTDPYTQTPASLCGANSAMILDDSLTFNTYLNEYMMTGLGTNFANPPQCGFYFSLSTDLVNWTPNQFIAPAYVPAPSNCQKPGAGGPAGSFAYASVIDPDDTSTNFESPGRTAYIYFTRDNDNTSDRDLVRVPVLITKY